MFLIVAVATVFFVLSRPSHKGTSATQPSSSVTANAAAQRLFCLASLVYRARSEYQLQPDPHDIPSGDKSPPSDFDSRQNTWLQQEGLWSSCSAEERMLFQKHLGTWSPQEIADGQWREESLGVLLWALDASRPLPPYDVPAVHTDVLLNVPTPDAAQTFVGRAKLRDTKEISKQRDIAELWLWRARTTQLQQDGTEIPKGMSLEEIIAKTAEKAAADHLFQPLENDFPALGKSYSKLTKAEWETMRSIATERLYALNWLCGTAADWDSVETGT